MAGVFYAEVLPAVNAARIPVLVGGTYALERYTGIARNTKDLDLFIRAVDWPDIAGTLGSIGLETELPFSHWLGRARDGRRFVDFVFAGGNGLVRVDDGWFDHAPDDEVHGEPVLVCPPEELIWSKSFVMERERFDGADVLHLVRAQGRRLDWMRLRQRFDRHWAVLLAHIVLFDFVYPDSAQLVPEWIRRDLTCRFRRQEPAPARVCRGPLVSRACSIASTSGRAGTTTRVSRRTGA